MKEFRVYRRGANKPLTECGHIEDGRVEWEFGCNGSHHARRTYKARIVNDCGRLCVHVSKEKEVKVVGRCDGSCTNKERDLGSFS